MPICITCSTPVKNLYTTYSKADDRALGKGVRLTQCPNCKRFADKYVEHDYIVLFIDLVLIKPQVYRHLLFNRLWNPNDALDPSILRLGILLILFDVYITWARIERFNSSSSSESTSRLPEFLLSSSSSNNFSNAPIITQYLFFLTLNVVATVVQHSVIRGLARVLVRPSSTRNSNSSIDGLDGPSGTAGSTSPNPLHHTRSNSSPLKSKSSSSFLSPNPTLNSQLSSTVSTSALDIQNTAPSRPTTAPPQSNQPPIRLDTKPKPPLPSISHPTTNQADPQQAQHHQQPVLPSAPTTPSPSAISTALLVSSCTKLFPILLVIWPTSTSSSSAPSTSASLSQLAPFAHRATSYIGWIVLLNNIEALLILLDCGYVVATAMAVAGFLSRWLVEGWLLGLVGLVREAEGPVGDAGALWKWVLGRA